MNPNDLTPEAFKQRIVQKYPNGTSSDGTPYSQMDATQLTQQIVSKYPNGTTSDGHKYSEFLPQQQATSTDSSGSQDQGNILQKGVNFLFPLAGDIGAMAQGKPTGKSPGQILADTALTALPFIPGLGEVGEAGRAAEGAGMLSKIAASPITRNAAAGYGAGVAQGVQQGQSLGQAAMPNMSNITGAATGGVLGGLLGRAGGSENTLRQGAIEDITKVLSPTTKLNKQITQKIAPELAQRSPLAMSRESLLSKYETLKGTAGEALEQGYSELPQDAKFEVGNLFDSLQKKIDSYTVNGAVPSSATSRVSALQKMMQDLANTGLQTSEDGSKVFSDVANVRKLRQIVDDSVAAAKKNFSPSDFDSAKLGAEKELGNSIREEFGKQFPNIAKLNKDFSFWSSASKVLSDSIERKTGQTGLLRKGIATGLGMGAGVSSGHPIIGGAISKMLSDFIESPAWHTTSAALKSKLANSLSKMDFGGANKIIQQAMKAVPVVGARGAQGLLNYITTPQ